MQSSFKKYLRTRVAQELNSLLGDMSMSFAYGITWAERSLAKMGPERKVPAARLHGGRSVKVDCALIGYVKRNVSGSPSPNSPSA